MPKTIVKCSMPECPEKATIKVAAPWKRGEFTELTTYGYACTDHSDSVLSYAQRRPRSRHLAADETMGEITSYRL